MIAAMASLANNSELINKVVPKNQTFKNKSLTDYKEISEFVFNLYKHGKLYHVVVNESLTFWNDSVDSNNLYYSDGMNQNFVGPLLEKALVELLFAGNYKLARSIDGAIVLTSFSNALFEEFYDSDLVYLGYNLKDVLTHGINTNSLMVVTLKIMYQNIISLKTMLTV